MRKLRQKKDWTQEDLGEKLSVSRQTIISIEKGRYNPSLELAIKISKIFDKPVNQIFQLEEKDD